MKILLNIIIFFMFSLNAISGQIIFDYYGFYDWDKIVDINKDRRFVVFNTNGIGTSNIGVETTGGCDGFLEYFKEEIDKSLEIEDGGPVSGPHHSAWRSAWRPGFRPGRPRRAPGL